MMRQIKLQNGDTLRIELVTERKLNIDEEKFIESGVHYLAAGAEIPLPAARSLLAYDMAASLRKLLRLI